MDFGFAAPPPGMPARYVDRPDRRRLIDPASPAFGALSTAAIAGLTLIEHRRLGPVAHAAFRVAEAVTVGLYTKVTTAPRPSSFPAAAALVDESVFVRDRSTTLGVIAGSASIGLAEPLETLDARLVDWLRDQGVRRPRWLLAAGTAVLTVAGYAGDRAQRSALLTAMDSADAADESAEPRPLEPPVLAILHDMVRHDIPGAEALRLQLDTAQQISPEYVSPTDIQLVVDEDTPRAVPHTQRWPVQGRFTQDGVELSLELQIHQGRLEMLSVMVPDPADPDDWSEEDDEHAQEAIAALTAWPEETRVRYVMDHADAAG